jgi:PKD repeat protein
VAVSSAVVAAVICTGLVLLPGAASAQFDKPFAETQTEDKLFGELPEVTKIDAPKKVQQCEAFGVAIDLAEANATKVKVVFGSFRKTYPAKGKKRVEIMLKAAGTGKQKIVVVPKGPGGRGPKAKAFVKVTPSGSDRYSVSVQADAGGNQMAAVGQPVTFLFKGTSGVTGDSIALAWDFDGKNGADRSQPDGKRKLKATGGGVKTKVERTYYKQGMYTVTLWAADSFGCWDDNTAKVNVTKDGTSGAQPSTEEEPPPEVLEPGTIVNPPMTGPDDEPRYSTKVTADAGGNRAVALGQPVSFLFKAVHAEADADVTFYWDFDTSDGASYKAPDGQQTTSSGKVNATHTYATPGMRTLILWVMDSDGYWDDNTIKVNVVE